LHVELLAGREVHGDIEELDALIEHLQPDSSRSPSSRTDRSPSSCQPPGAALAGNASHGDVQAISACRRSMSDMCILLAQCIHKAHAWCASGRAARSSVDGDALRSTVVRRST
jgi:hypothetical protein